MVYDYAEKQILVRVVGIQKENWGQLTMHFLEIIKVQIGENACTLLPWYNFIRV